MIRFNVLSALFIFLHPALSCQEPPPGDEGYRLDVPARAGGGEGPLDWVFEKVDSARDDWSVERASDQLKVPLDKLSAWLVTGKPDIEELEKLLAGEFSSAGLVPKTWK